MPVELPLFILTCAIVVFVLALWLGWIERLRVWLWMRYWERRGGKWTIAVADASWAQPGDRIVIGDDAYTVTVVDGATLTVKPSPAITE